MGWSLRVREMRLITLVLLLLQVLNTGDAKKRRVRKHLDYQDCGSNPDRPIFITNLDVRPLPVESPGRARLKLAVNITRALPETMGMDVSISKYFFGVPFKIPCYNNVGTCHYRDVCAFLTRYDREGCPGFLERRGLPCSCPFQPGLISIKKLIIRVPRLSGFLAFLAKGEYEASIRLYDNNSREELGCVKATLAMRHRHRPKRKEGAKKRRERRQKRLALRLRRQRELLRTAR